MADNKNMIDEARDAKDSNEPEIKYQDEAPVFTERKRWLFFGLPWTFTQYLLKDEILTTNKCEKMFGLGTVVCYTSDTTDKVLRLQHVRYSEQIKNFILEKSEKMRMKRRTLNTMSLNADASDGVDDIG